MAGPIQLRLEDLREDLLAHTDQDRAEFASVRKWLSKVDGRTKLIMGLIIGVNGLPIWILAILQAVKLLRGEP